MKLLFSLLGANTPKQTADLLNEFDPSVNIDPETIGRWLRGERRPSKRHLNLIIRLLQARGLMGKVPAKDRLLMRIAAFYAKIYEPDSRRMKRGGIRSTGQTIARSAIRRSAVHRMRDSADLASAFQLDLINPGEGYPSLMRQLSSQRRKRLTF